MQVCCFWAAKKSSGGSFWILLDGEEQQFASQMVQDLSYQQNLHTGKLT